MDDRVKELSAQIDALENELRERVETRRLEILHEDGTVRGWMGVNDDRAAEFSLSDGSGVERAAIRVAADGTPSLTLYDDNGGVAIALELIDRRSRPRLVLRHLSGRTVTLEVDTNGASGVFVSDERSCARAEIAMDAAGAGYVLLRGPDGVEKRIQG